MEFPQRNDNLFASLQPPPGTETYVCPICHNQKPDSPSSPQISQQLLEYFSRKTTYKVYCRADPTYYLSIRDDKVILARSDPADQLQHWYKDDEYGRDRKDRFGYPGFALVNKVTGQAMKRPIKPSHPVQLVSFDPNRHDESLLFSEANDLGEWFRAIRMTTEPNYHLDAFHAEKGVYHGTIVGMGDWQNGRWNQQWRITPHLSSPGSPSWLDFSSKPTYKIHCKSNPHYKLTVRDAKVIIASDDPNDQFQNWCKDEEYAKERKGSFALINKATGLAIKYADNNQPVKLIPYHQDIYDGSLLWYHTDDSRNYEGIRRADNPGLTLDGLYGNNGVYDGTLVGISNWNGGDNQLWKITEV